MTRLRSLIKEVLSQPKKKDCNCGCNDCGGKAPILTEGKVKHLISEGLQYHIDKKIQLHESVYRIGSEKHFELIREARALWVRGIIDVSKDDQAILETNLGHFGMYEGEAVPLDMPMVNEKQITAGEVFVKNLKKTIQQKFKFNPKITTMPDKSIVVFYPVYLRKQLHPFFDSLMEEGAIGDFGGVGMVVTDVENKSDNTTLKLASQPFKNLYEIKMPSQEEVDKFFSITQNEMHYLNSKPVMGQKGDRVRSEIEPWDEYDLSNWNALVRKAKAQGKINEGFKDYLGYSDHTRSDSGLNVVPKDQIHANKLLDAIEDSGMYAEWNTREGYFFFPEEEDGYDQLEMDIQDLMDENNIQGYIEGVFEESLNEVHKLLRQTNLSSEEYQKAKKLKGFNADDYTFSSDNNLYVKKESLEERINRILEAKKKKKKDPPIGKPKRGGPKAYYVYVRDPKTKRIKKVTFGSGGLRAKIRNPKARNAFAKRHRCSEKNDRTKPSYWSCRLPRYAKQLGLGSNMNTFW